MGERVQNSAEIHQLLQEVGHKTGYLYDFITVATGMLNTIRQCANGTELTIVEVRTIMMIQENPGITATQLCHNWNRSRGAISQILKKIEQKGFIYRKKSQDNDKIFRLYPTQAGIQLASDFIEEDSKDTTNLIRSLLERCTVEELRSFYKVINLYRQVLLEKPESRWQTKLE